MSSILSKHMKSPLLMKERIPDSQVRSKTTLNENQQKGKFKSKYRNTIEAHDIEGKNKGVKSYMDTYEKKKGNKSKFKRFYGTEGERGIQQKSKLIGSGIKERKLTKKGTKKRIAKAEQNLKDI